MHGAGDGGRHGFPLTRYDITETALSGAKTSATQPIHHLVGYGGEKLSDKEAKARYLVVAWIRFLKRSPHTGGYPRLLDQPEPGPPLRRGGAA